MDAERLIALEAALAELGGLYTTARVFTALEQAAEHEFLPELSTLSSQLRALNRTDRLSQRDIDATSRRILDLRTSWQDRLAGVRTSDAYRRAVAAHRNDDQAALANLIPGIFARVRVASPTTLYFGISVAVRRRGPGTSPFLSAAACADKIETAVRDGLTPPAHGAEWWDEDLPSISCAPVFADLDTPFAVVAVGGTLPVVFSDDGNLSYRVYTQHLTASFRVEIAAEADDEWWQAYEQSYDELRDELCALLANRGIAHSVVTRDERCSGPQ